jgi:hypothetical protein
VSIGRQPACAHAASSMLYPHWRGNRPSPADGIPGCRYDPGLRHAGPGTADRHTIEWDWVCKAKARLPASMRLTADR